MLEKFELKIAPTDDNTINLYELSQFLYLFRGVYVLALEGRIRYDSLSGIVFNEIEAPISGLAFAQISGQALESHLDINFSAVSTNSPLKFTGYAAGVCMIALTTAVIVSGGTADLKIATFSLPPLAKTIREIKSALRQPPPRPLPSERKKTTNRDKSP